jgi:hypothetical protein
LDVSAVNPAARVMLRMQKIIPHDYVFTEQTEFFAEFILSYLKELSFFTNFCDLQIVEVLQVQWTLDCGEYTHFQYFPYYVILMVIRTLRTLF